MAEQELLEKLNVNIQEFAETENAIAMLELAKYQKTLENLKKAKLNSIKNYFEAQAVVHNQKTKRFEKRINELVEKYEQEIESLIEIYNKLYLDVFKSNQMAINNQIIAITNVVMTTRKLKALDAVADQKEQLEKIRIACAEKKLNYSLIMMECKARKAWCIERCKEAINEIFVTESLDLALPNRGMLDIFDKFEKFLANIFIGKKKFNKVLNKFDTETIPETTKKKEENMVEIARTIKGFNIQMQETKQRITEAYATAVA